MNHRLPVATLRVDQAIDREPTLATLARRVRQSSEWLAAIRPVLPIGLRPVVQAGPIDEEGTWCLLVPHNAAAAKLRQLVPSLLERLQHQGHGVEAIRIRVSAR